jgi:hypothetical protein
MANPAKLSTKPSNPTNLTKTRPTTYTNITSTTNTSTSSTKWQTIGLKGKPKSNKTTPRPINKPKPKDNRLILIQSQIGNNTHFSLLVIYNSINTTFTNKGIKNPIIVLVNKGMG